MSFTSTARARTAPPVSPDATSAQAQREKMGGPRDPQFRCGSVEILGSRWPCSDNEISGTGKGGQWTQEKQEDCGKSYTEGS